MKSGISVGGVIMLVALLLALLPESAVTARPAEASTCNWAQFIADVTVPDGTNVRAGLTFTKTWRLKNIGTCTWTTSYTLVFSSGDQLGGPSSVNLPATVPPGQTVDASVTLTAPTTAGHYIGFWQFKNAAGGLFGLGSNANKAWWVDINVLPVSTVGVAYDFAANYCSANWYSTQGNLPCPGTDGDSQGFVLKVDNPQLENGAFSTDSGLIMMPQDAFNGDIHGAFPAFRVQSGDRFRSVVNCAFGATSCFVTFRLDYQIGNGPINTFWSLREKYDGLFFRTDLNLSSLAGQDVKFILTVLATGSATGDRALWSNPIIARAGPTPPAPYARNFDFGTSTSPLATGYTRVTETTAYTTGAFGWADTSGLESRDRSSQSDALKRDFVMSSSAARVFKVDLPNNTYAVTVTMGDNDSAHDNMVVKANGTTVLGDVDTAAGAFSVNTFNATVSSETLSLEFSDAGGTDSAWVVNGVAISTGSTPPPAGCGDRAQFVKDVNVPDGMTFAPGAVFTKTWRLKNVGTCTWTTSYALVFDTGEKMGGPDLVNLPQSVAPGQTVDVSVNLAAPSSAGSYRGYWKFRNSAGVPFGIGAGNTKSWWVDIRVSGTAATSTPTATPAMTSTPTTSPTVTTTPSTATPTPAMTSTPTTTPTVTATPATATPTQPPAACDRVQFVADVTVPDGKVYAPGAAFLKTWRLRNVGTCTWTTSYALVFDSGEKMGGPDSVSMPKTVPPGSSVDVSVNLTAPGTAGSYRGFWRFQNASGVRFGLGTAGTKSWWVDIRVSGTAATPTPSVSTSTPTPTATGTDTTGWNVYSNAKYGFSFKYPPGSSIETQSDNSGRVNLPFTSGTTLSGKWIDVSVVEGANPCKSPDAGQVTSSGNVTINGIQFLKELGMNGTAGHFYDITAYSTLNNNACISLAFVLKSVDPGVFTTPPPAYNKAAESAVFPIIMSTFGLSGAPATATPTNTPPASTSTPTPTATPTSSETTGWNTFVNGKYLFSFKYPPGSTVVSQSDTDGHLTLPFKAGTNLLEKHLDVSVAEGVTPCKSPVSNPNIPPENVTFNGIPFLKETWVEGATSHRGDFAAYSTAKGNACITLTFWLWSVVPEVNQTPPPRFDFAAESAVFTIIMSTYGNQ